MEIYTYKDFTIGVDPTHILIEKDNSRNRVHATLKYDRNMKTSTFSGQYPWVRRDDFINRSFDTIVEIIGTSTKVTLVKAPVVQAILDSIKK